MASKKVVLVTGASGSVGKAAIAELAALSDSIEVKAGVRNPEKPAAAELAQLGSNVTVVAADPLIKEDIAKAVEGVDYVFVIPPGHEDRQAISIAAIEAAKAAGVKFLLLLSVSTADSSDTIFGAQFLPIEAAAKDSGLPFAIIRAPIFLDNTYGSAGSIKEQGAIYGSFEPDKGSTQVAVKDLGAVAAKILSNPSPHTGKTYWISSPSFTYTQLATAFTETLGKPVNYVQVPYDGTKQFLLGIGFPEWQADGVVELNRLINEGATATNNPQGAIDTEAILGRPATTVEEWVKAAAPAFE